MEKYDEDYDNDDDNVEEDENDFRLWQWASGQGGKHGRMPERLQNLKMGKLRSCSWRRLIAWEAELPPGGWMANSKYCLKGQPTDQT